jgi:hypothetical protein
MPNHCDSDFTITGPSERLGEFMAKHVTANDGSLLNLDSIRPYPAHFKEMDRIAREYEEQHPEAPWQGRPKDGFNSGGYEWRIENWGTKWGCYKTWGCETPIERTDDGVVLHFSTAWSPFATTLLVELSTRFPELRFQYGSYECGMGFQQHTVVEHGRVLRDCREAYDGDRGG